MITSIDQEGTGTGCDIDLMKKIRSIVSIPIIAHGSIGNIKYIDKSLMKESKCSSNCIINSLWHSS